MIRDIYRLIDAIEDGEEHATIRRLTLKAASRTGEARRAAELLNRLTSMLAHAEEFPKGGELIRDHLVEIALEIRGLLTATQD